MRTEDPGYAGRLGRLESAWWKRWLDVQRPYRWHLRSLRLGFVLDVGCGLGRNLVNLGGRGAGVGIDHNAEAIAVARRRGLDAYLPDEFRASSHGLAGRFDALLFSHVLEHMTWEAARALIADHLGYLRPGGRVVLITPGEAGFRSDPTHVELMNLSDLGRLATANKLEILKQYCFPFPRPVGLVFKYNEFVLVAQRS